MKKKIPVITIDTGVPIPELAGYPFDKLGVGDSFQVPIDRRASVASMAVKHGQRTGAKFVVRKVDDSNVRVWRTE